MSNSTKLSSLSAFFPCYNEEKNVAPMIETFLNVLPKVAARFEIIVVNDGSSDRTQAVAEELAQKHKEVRVVSHKMNRGYGAALRTGIASAQYDWTFWTDGDLQFDLVQMLEFLPHTERFNAVIGYRKNRAEGFMRVLNTALYTLFINLLFRLHVHDIDCAFKLIKTSVLQSLPLTSTGAFTSAEILYRLRRRRVKFKELPVRHLPRKHGSPTGNNPKVILRALIEALQLRALTILHPLR